MQLQHSYYWFKEALDPDTCNKIITLGTNQLNLDNSKGINTNANTFGDSHKEAMPDAVSQGELSRAEIKDSNKQHYIRDSKVSWLSDSWLYDLIYPFINEANAKSGWNFDWDCSEDFQFTVYDHDGFYGWHTDGVSDHSGVYKRYIKGITPTPLKPDGRVPNGYCDRNDIVGKVRKLSMTINLNKPGDYEGGNLKFDFGHHTEDGVRFYECEEIRPQGSIIIFPSFIPHCVTPVTKGTRYSLVLWSLGYPFR
tara:strand:- start:7201 stop:7956 length:756 start_codon:yes stop_codon:yes gene_type:complete